MLVTATAGALVIGHFAGKKYRPQSLQVAAAEVSNADRALLVFGNSRTEASINAERLSELLLPASRAHRQPLVRAYSGGGWDSLHYFMLSLLNAPQLRAGRDVVLIESSPLSTDDSITEARLGAIRPEVVKQLLELPGVPIELRLTVLTGAISGTFRYRETIQSMIIEPRLLKIASTLELPIRRVGLIGPDIPPAYRLITEANRNFVVERIEGDQNVLREEARSKQLKIVSRLRFGGYKWAAFEAAVKALRARNIDVFLLEVPVSAWLQERLEAAGVAEKHRIASDRLCMTTGCRRLAGWDDFFKNPEHYWDESHMTGGTTSSFTAAVANRLVSEINSLPN